MTFIIDMASGTEDLGDELGCISQTDLETPRHAPAMTQEPMPQLQLEMIDSTVTQETPADRLAGLDLDRLIRSIED